MSKSRLVAKNTFYLFLDRILRGFMLMALTVWVARALGVKAFGVYALAVTIGGIFRVVNDFGISFRAAYEVAKDPGESSRIFTQGLVLKIVMSIIGMTCLVIGVGYCYPAQVQKAIGVAAFAYLLLGYIEYANAIFGGQERMEYISLNMVLHMSLVFCFMGMLLIIGVRSAPILLFGHLSAGVLGILFAWNLLRRKFDLRLVKIKGRELKTFLIKTLPFGLYFLSDVIYFHTDIIMLSFYQGEHAVGLYQSAMKLIQFAEAAPLLFVSALFPTLSRTYKGAPETVSKILSKSSGYLFILSLPLAVGTWFLSEGIILYLFGAEYASAGRVLKILAIMIPFRYAAFLFGTALTASGKQQGRMIMVAITALINICLNAWWIPLWGLAGAAGASVVSALILALYFAYGIRNITHLSQIFLKVFRPLIACIIMGGGIYFARTQYNIFINIALGIVIYTIIIFAIKGINKQDLEMIKKILTSRKDNAVKAD